jgi:Rrf2 family protein
MKVSAKAEYACIAMVDLAARYADRQPVQIRTIAAGHGISPRFLEQILLQLKGAGLVGSSRGAAGGYQLTRPPEAISLADIVSAIDRSPAVGSDLSAVLATPVVQAVRDVWQQISAEEQRILARTTLAELVRRSASGDSLTYQI